MTEHPHCNCFKQPFKPLMDGDFSCEFLGRLHNFSLNLLYNISFSDRKTILVSNFNKLALQLWEKKTFNPIRHRFHEFLKLPPLLQSLSGNFKDLYHTPHPPQNSEQICWVGWETDWEVSTFITCNNKLLWWVNDLRLVNVWLWEKEA